MYFEEKYCVKIHSFQQAFLCMEMGQIQEANKRNIF